MGINVLGACEFSSTSKVLKISPYPARVSRQNQLFLSSPTSTTTTRLTTTTTTTLPTTTITTTTTTRLTTTTTTITTTSTTTTTTAPSTTTSTTFPPTNGVKGHPGLIINQIEINALKQMINQPGWVQDFWLRTKKIADDAVQGVDFLKGQALVDLHYLDWQNLNMNQVGQPMAALGLAYALTGNKIYADRAADILKVFSANAPGFGGHGILDGVRQGFIISFLWSLDLIYHSGSLTSAEITNLENWFKKLVSVNNPLSHVYNTGGGHWANSMHGIRRYYLSPEQQVPLFFRAALGLFLEDPVMIDWGLYGAGYPYIFNDHQQIPTSTQNPYSLTHFIHDSFLPDGSNFKVLDREPTPYYGNTSMLAAQVVIQAAWQRGIDLWRYRDPQTDNNIQTGIDWQARYAMTLAVPGTGLGNTSVSGDSRDIFFLPYSHFRSELYWNAIQITNGNGTTNPSGLDPLAGCHRRHLNFLGPALVVASAINRSNPTQTNVNLGPITQISYHQNPQTAMGATAFEVLAPGSTYNAGDSIPLTIRAIQSSGATATNFVGTVKLLSPNQSPGTSDYMSGNKVVTVIDSTLDISPGTVSFLPADQGVKTIQVRLKNRAVGASYRIEAAYSSSLSSYPDNKGSLVINGFSNRLYIK